MWSHESTPQFDNLTPETRERLESLCGEFERAWQVAGVEPEIANYLEQLDDPERSVLFRELILRDLGHREKRGERPTRQWYESRFPDYTDLLSELFGEGTSTPTVSESRADSEEKRTVSEQDEPRTKIPKKVGRYEVLEVLGEGTFGTVLRCFDPHLEVDVAIKIPRLNRDWSTTQSQAFLREARRAAQLRKHSNIVRVLDVQETNGTWYIVMELVVGRSLSELSRSAPLTPGEAAHLVASVADAVHFSHQQQFVHRDIKPGNILVDEAGTPYLTDFGLAATEEEQAHEKRGIRGTIAYMSPEQAMGMSHLVGPTSDIYALGVVLYELLAGVRPFQGTRAQILEKIQHQSPKSPSFHRPECPKRLEEICSKCTRKNPEDRYQTAEELATDLRAWDHEEEPVAQRTASIPVLVALAFVAVAVVSVAIAMSNGSRAPNPPVQPSPSQQRTETPHFDPEEVGVEPGKWYSLLNWRPKIKSLPDEPNGELKWEQGKSMRLFSAKSGLVVLGTAARPGYKVRLTLRQSPWIGNVGIFFGFHWESAPDGGMKNKQARYQLYKFHPHGDGCTIERNLALDQNANRLGNPLPSPRGGEGIRIFPDGLVTLEFEITNKGVESVVWNEHTKLPKLALPPVNTQFLDKYPKIFEGDFGIQTAKATTTILLAEVQFLEEYFEAK